MKRFLVIAGPLAVFMFLVTSCNDMVTVQQVDSPMRPPETRRYVKVNALNLRECPGTQCRIMRVLQQGDGGLVLSEDSGWVEMLIDHSDSQGWVAGKYLSEQPVARTKVNKPKLQKKTQPALPEEEFAQPTRSIPPELQEELALPESDNTAEAKTVISEEFAE